MLPIKGRIAVTTRKGVSGEAARLIDEVVGYFSERKTNLAQETDSLFCQARQRWSGEREQ